MDPISFITAVVERKLEINCIHITVYSDLTDLISYDGHIIVDIVMNVSCNNLERYAN